MRVSAIIRAIAGLLACGVMAACSAPADRADGEGGEGGPTFVSLNPCLDAILAQVAAPEQILALSHYSRDPAASSMDVALAKRFAMTGGTAEEIITLQPDIVLAGAFIAPSTRAALERTGMRVETFGSPASVEESLAQIRAVGALTGDAGASEGLVMRIASGPPPPDGAPIPALLWQPGQIVAGDASLVSEHLRWAGLSSHSAALGLGQADHVSLERLLAEPPRILLVAGDSVGQRHPMLEQMRSGLVADFDPGLFYCAGPSIPAARERLLEIRERFEREYGHSPA